MGDWGGAAAVAPAAALYAEIVLYNILQLVAVATAAAPHALLPLAKSHMSKEPSETSFSLLPIYILSVGDFAEIVISTKSSSSRIWIYAMGAGIAILGPNTTTPMKLQKIIFDE